MSRNSVGGRITRRLRFRMTAVHLAFFAVVLAMIGVGFRQILSSIQDRQNRLLLEEQWGALRGYLRLRSSGPVWLYAEEKPEQASVVARLRQVFFLADADGQVLQISANYRMIGADSPEEIREAIRLRRPVWKLRRDSRGVPYLVRAGVLSDRSNRLYYAAIGRSLLVNRAVLSRFTLNYFAFLPVIILAGGILGWFLTGRALRPLNDVVKASQRISGSNLSLRIASRGAGDELDHLIKTFNQMMDRLEDSFRHIKQFSTDVSHELRTPITGARGQLEVALFTAETTHQYREAIQNALEETERLSRLVNAMLLLSQAESGQLGLQKERLNLSGILRESLEQFELAAEEAKVKLVVDVPKECMAEADRVQFDRLVANLLTNAIKFTPPDGEVRVRLASDEGSVVLTVEDTGCGIPPDHVSRVFERFYRVPTVESAMERGLGLGLSFVAWIVRAHNGKIEVESTLGKGSRFIVTLPDTSPTAVPPVLEAATREVESSQVAS